MTTNTPSSPELPDPAAPVPQLDDDIDFRDVELGPRQEDAIKGFVCEGGCE